VAFANFLAATPAVKGTGASALADFNNDGYADYADHYLPTGAFWIHQNRKKLTPPNDFDPWGRPAAGAR
jgi:hypothetical protein